MKEIWLIDLDRYGDESRAKSFPPKVYSMMETARLIKKKYDSMKIKPEIEVIAIGLGLGLSDALEGMGIPHKCRTGLLKRIGSADIYSFAKKVE